MNFDDEQAVHESRRAAERRARDFDDLQNELAGNATGRASRFLPPEAAGGNAAEKRRTERAEAHTRLQLMLMANPAYAALYADTMARLGEAERATARALEKAEQRQREAEQALEDLRRRAVRLDDGRLAYEDDDGSFRTEDGAEVDEAELGAARIPEDPARWKAFEAASEETDEARSDVDEIRVYQVEVLGAARDRVDDHDDPPGMEEMGRINRDIGERMPPAVKSEVETRPAVVPAYTASLTVDVPKL